MLLSISLPLSLLLSYLSVVHADKTYHLDIAAGTVAPDGFSRTGITVNGGFGAPLLTAQKNDRLLVNISNSIHDDTVELTTSIHWHGMLQHRTATEDGVGFVTQCPIVPDHYYNYNFSTAGQTGTYWYHSHTSTQYCDGLRGPLVIYDPQDPRANLYDVDDESTVITLGDWYTLPAKQAQPAGSAVVAPNPRSILINDKGRSASTPSSPLSVINVERSKRYRFRLINVSCFTNMNVSIDGHPFTVIEADGIETQSRTVDSLIIFPGQRYSIVVQANQAVNNYWFRAVPSPRVDNSTTVPFELYGAVFRYDGAPNTEPTTLPTPGGTPLNESSLAPLFNPGSPGGPNPHDLEPPIVLNIGRNATTNTWMINNGSFFPPHVPVLLQILSGNKTAQSLLPPDDVYVIKPNRTYEVRIPAAITATIDRAHPFHLHGHTFDLVQAGGQTIPNYSNPPRRDVAPVFGGGIVFRFRTDNPGPWILHCHIDWHLEQGMAIVFAEDPSGMIEGPNSLIIPPAYNDLCPAYYKFASSH